MSVMCVVWWVLLCECGVCWFGVYCHVSVMCVAM